MNKLLAKLTEKLKLAGLKITPQRLEVLNLFYGKKLHPTADEVWRNVRKKFPAIPKATVYNILDTFVEKGIVKVLIIGKEMRFDFNTSFHGHFVCKKCGKIYDVDLDCVGLGQGNLPVLSEGHKVEDFQLNFFGICKNCLKKEGK